MRDPDPQPAEPDSAGPRAPLSRRSFLKGTVTAGSAAAVGPHAVARPAPRAPEPGRAPSVAGEAEVKLRINGEERTLTVEPRTTLLDALRTRLEPALTGTKIVCDTGSCGACTVLLDGRPVYACLSLALDAVGREVTTVEGLGSPDEMSDVQRAFCEEDALMCGYCTPGFVVACHAALERRPDGSLDELKHEVAGNLCRCGTYPHVFNALQKTQAERRGARKK